VLAAMLLGLPLGVVIGLLPGLSGITAFAFLIPFTFGMSPLVGLAFLLASYAAVSQGGSMTAIVLGVPGEVPNAATVIDGYPMAKAGRAGEAIGAALMASALGGLFGCVLLAILLPVIQPIVLSFASPENFVLAVAGICFIAVLSSGSPRRGLIAGAFGVFLSLFGYSPTEGVPRFWMGFDYLVDGFRLVPLAMGLFAMPEILELMRTGSSIAQGGDAH
jgi:TctA family transporter